MVCSWAIKQLGDQAMFGQRSEQTITRGRGSLCGRIVGRGGRLVLVVASIACMPALAGCSSSASNDYSTAASAYPSQSLADLFRGSRSSSPPAQAVAPPPPATPSPPAYAASTATAGTPLAGVSPPGVAFARAPAPPLATAVGSPTNTAMVNPPAPSGPSGGAASPVTSAPSDDYDAAADAYPSVALFDIFRRDAQEAAAPSNSAAQAANPAVPGQPAPVGQPAPTAPGGTATAAPGSAASASSGDYDAAASAYPSVSLHDLILGPRSSTN
jgi:hypothetical protein